MFALIVSLLLVPQALTDAEATSHLNSLRADFAARPKTESVLALERLVAQAPATQASVRALLWLGDLAHQGQDDRRAAQLFHSAYGRATDAELRRLAARGLGDLALLAGNYSEARRQYGEAAKGATPLLAAELMQKQVLTERLATRANFERIAWAILAGALIWFLFDAALRRGPVALVTPAELLYVAPVYLLLIVGCLGRDRDVLRALVMGAIGSLALIGLSGLAAQKSPPGGPRRFIHLGLLVAGNVALFYVALRRAGLIDTVLFTVQLTALQG